MNEMNKEKILITGGAGYLGSILTECLLSLGYEVNVYDNLLYNQLSLNSFCHNKSFNFIYGDVLDHHKLKENIVNNDIVIPLAAIVGMPACNKNETLAIDVNYNQIKFIVENISKDQKLIMPNTNSQYGSSSEVITEDSHFVFAYNDNGLK